MNVPGAATRGRPKHVHRPAPRWAVSEDYSSSLLTCMASSRERERAERRKRKERGTERGAELAAKREAMAARTEAKNEAARDELEPLEQGERPLVVTIGAIISA